MSIAENIAAVRQQMDQAARETGRTGADVILVGASKMNDAAACQEAIAAGIDALGENRVQEMTAKLAENAYAGRPLHFIGHLQRNKVRQVVGKADLIQSVGSTELLQEIEKAAGRLELCQDILLEVNIGGEAAKSGFAPEDIAAAAETALAMPHVRVRGLMTIPPVSVNGHERRFCRRHPVRQQHDPGGHGNFRRTGLYKIKSGGKHMSLKDEFKKFIHPYDDEDEPVEYQEDDYQDRPRRDDRREERRDEERRSKVVNIHATTQLKVVLVKPSKYDEDATAIADHLLEKRTVVVNMENTDPDTARRLLDFVSGVAYATGGKVKRVAAKTYIATPYSVDLMGDLIDELENSGLYM